MRKLTARILLTLSLVGVLAPLALAISAPAPHACCMRKAHDVDNNHHHIQASATCCNHDCCRTVTVSQWAELSSTGANFAANFTAKREKLAQSSLLPTRNDSTHSGRAPPTLSIT